MYFAANCSTRGLPRVVVILPNCAAGGLAAVPRPALVATGLAKLGWFSRLNTSPRNIRFWPSRILNWRERPVLNVRKPGPSRLLRLERPKLPALALTNALVLNQQVEVPTGAPLGQLPLLGSPTISARSCLIPVREESVPPRTEK